MALHPPRAFATKCRPYGLPPKHDPSYLIAPCCVVTAVARCCRGLRLRPAGVGPAPPPRGRAAATASAAVIRVRLLLPRTASGGEEIVVVIGR